MNDFLVSAVIPVYNAEAFVEKAVMALLNEEEVGEIILVDDASTDKSWQVCKKLEDDNLRVKALKHPDQKNHGCGATRNFGLTIAKYDYIVFADADNFILPGRFKKDKEIFLNDPKVDGVYNAMGVYYYTDKAKEEFLNTVNMEQLTFSDIVPPERVFNVLIGMDKVKGSWGVDGLTLKRDLVNACGGFNTELKLQQDVDLFLKMSLVGNIYPGEIKEPLCVRGVHENHRSTDISKMNHYRRQMWKSVDTWIKKQDNLNNIHISLFKEQYTRFKIMRSEGATAFKYLLVETLKEPKLFSQSYGVFDFGFWRVFGKNKLTLSLVSIKNKCFK